MVLAPFLTYMFLSIICTNTAWIYIILALEFSMITMLFAFEIFVKILKFDTGTFEMQQIASCITEGKFPMNLKLNSRK